MTKGVYILLKNDDVIYIGASCNIESRLRAHVNKDYNLYVIIPYNKRYLYLELRLISFLQPQLNIQNVYPNMWHEDYDAFRGLVSGRISRRLNN
jgi:excinuclease UvrABC nuclease subunit